MKKGNLDIIDIRKALHDAGMKQSLAEVWAQILCKKTEVQADNLATKEQLNSVKDLLNAKIDGIKTHLNLLTLGIGSMLGLIIFLIEYHSK